MSAQTLLLHSHIWLEYNKVDRLGIKMVLTKQFRTYGHAVILTSFFLNFGHLQSARGAKGVDPSARV